MHSALLDSALRRPRPNTARELHYFAYTNIWQWVVGPIDRGPCIV